MARIENTRVYGLKDAIKTAKYPKAVDTNKLNYELTPGIKACLTCDTGEGHDNALNGIIVQFDMIFSLQAWPEAQRYHFLDFVSSQSKMHKLTKMDVASQCNKYVDTKIIKILENNISIYNNLIGLDKERREKLGITSDKIEEAWRRCIYNVPSGFELKAGMTTNYRQLKTIYQQRRHHRLPDWQVFCDWCESLPSFMELTQKETN